MKKWLFRIVLLLLSVLSGVLFWAWRNGRDRFPGYSVQINHQPGAASQLRAGFAARKVTPTLPDTWIDVNKNAQFDPEAGDTWTDGNANGRFDGYWLAGFQNRRPAQSVHDDIWARAMVIDDGDQRVAIVMLDIIGFGHDNVIRVRQRIPLSDSITYATIGSTHVHAAPDMLGIWGGDDYESGLNPAWSAYVIEQASAAIHDATTNMRPAYLVAATDPLGAANMVADTRKPEVLDPALHAIQAIDSQADTTLGMLVVWGNHPETTWNGNLAITSDFPHYVREYLEKGDSTSSKMGTVVYASGAIGGLMTTHPDLPILDAASGKSLIQPSFEKAQAQGLILSELVRASLEKGDTIRQASWGVYARTFDVPLDNTLFKIGVALNIFDRGYTKFGYLRTEAALLTLGSISILAVPGEIYPEIIHGGVEQPPGADFAISPVETPPLLPQMPGQRKIVMGLMNDEIGYIIPQSEWDTEPPYLYGATEQLYGEINSCGPLTAPLVYKQLVELCQQAAKK
jgi:hypothetical protein